MLFKMSVLRQYIVVSILILMCYSSVAQTEKNKASVYVRGDFVSSYIWRGAYMAGVSLQPEIGLETGRFSFSVWGTKALDSPQKEIDLTMSYSTGRFCFHLLDYWCPLDEEDEEGRVSNNYFELNNHHTSHQVEGGITYVVSERFPLTISWYMMFWGNDKKSDGKQNYSSYAEVGYPFSVKGIELNALVGVSPYNSSMYEVRRFAVCNIGLEAVKDIRVTKSFSLPVFVNLSFDPAHGDASVVLGFTLR